MWRLSFLASKVTWLAFPQLCKFLWHAFAESVTTLFSAVFPKALKAFKSSAKTTSVNSASFTGFAASS